MSLLTVEMAVVRQILLREWDPIGINEVPEAQDEYDNYVLPILELLQRRASVDELFAYLWRIETEHMCLRGNRSCTMAVARRLHREFVDKKAN